MNTRFVLLAALALALAACSPTATPPLAGARIGGPFTLIGEDGKAVTEQAFTGRYRIVYFGYTFCPDVCPTDVAALTRGLHDFAKADPARAARVVPIFITVDPARDTPAVLHAFTAQFDPAPVGLTGSAQAIADVTKAYGVAYSEQPAREPGVYMVDHSNAAYLMDPGGKPIALLSSDKGARAVAAELDTWVK